MVINFHLKLGLGKSEKRRSVLFASYHVKIVCRIGYILVSALSVKTFVFSGVGMLLNTGCDMIGSILVLKHSTKAFLLVSGTCCKRLSAGN